MAERAGRAPVAVAARQMQRSPGSWCRRLPAATAYTLLRRAGNHALHAWKIRRQRLAARMLALFLVWRCWQRLPLAFCRDFQIADTGLQLQQLQLLAGQLLAARSVLGDPLKAQPVFQGLNL